MFKARITNKKTQEIVEAEDCTLREALRLCNVAYFAAGYDDDAVSVVIINQLTGKFVPGYGED